MITSMNPTIGSSSAVAESLPRWFIATSVGLTSGSFRASAIYLTAGTVINKITFQTYTTAGSSVTGTWAGIFTLGAQATLVAATAQQSLSSMNTNTLFTWPIATIASGASSTYTVPSTGIYYVGACVTATTPPTVVSNNSTALNTLSPYLAINLTGSTNPASIGTTYVVGASDVSPYYALT